MAGTGVVFAATKGRLEDKFPTISALHVVRERLSFLDRSSASALAFEWQSRPW